jgi:hypothetical protein
MMTDNKKFGHYQDGHLTLLVQFSLQVLQGALPVMEICRLGNQHICIQAKEIIAQLPAPFFVPEMRRGLQDRT